MDFLMNFFKTWNLQTFEVFLKTTSHKDFPYHLKIFMSQASFEICSKMPSPFF